MSLTASKLRQDIYRILDEILASGEPVEIERHGRRLRIVPDQPRSRLARLPSRPDFVLGDSDELIHLDWSGEWQPRGDDGPTTPGGRE
ncbi:MAG: hypothetical protein ACRCYQ_00215 [Nocardioides sp.]